MLYESDSSVPDEDEEDSNELLANQPSTSQTSQEIFTIQMSAGQPDGLKPCDGLPKTPTYSHLETNDYDDDDDVDVAAEGRPSFLSSLSLGNLHKARSFLNKQKLGKASKSDTQFHYIKRHGPEPKVGDVIPTNDTPNSNADQSEDSDDDVTLTSRSQSSGGRNPKRWSYDPGGSGLLTPWSTYSELLLEFQGLSWDCCVALVVRTCISEQCQAKTKFLKMAAWFTVFVLILLCFRPQVYHTVIRPSGSVPDQRHSEQSGVISLMDILQYNNTS